VDDGTIQFDTGPLGGGTLFAAPRATVRADTPEEVPGALAALARAQAAGGWLAGFASYELGHVFSGKLAGLMPARRDTPLLHFGVFDAPAPAPPAAPRGPVRLTPARPGWDFATYRAAFERVQAYISAGDIYQANLTFPMTARAEGAPRDLYAALAARQPVGHGALVALGGGPAILSRSPELFFEVDAAGVIETRPMKGTVPRGATPEEDRARRDWLAASEKNQAENLMIVDLLRNDISRVAALGSVQVPRMFRIESYATVHQMTSVVRARLAAGAGLPEIFAALFPCGSVTGAPKIRAMQVIHELEDGPRGIYCGAIGWAAPDGRMAFNVAIRTLSLFADGRVRFNVGGGVVHDSTAEAEYEEALWKARFAALSPGG
jgi:para-aminobenzoate synthetase component 1